MASSESEKLSRSKQALLGEIASEIRDRRVLDAIGRVPREIFLPEEPGTRLRQQATAHRLRADDLAASDCRYDDAGADAEGDERVLEVGTGSGYQAAVLSLLATLVVTVERIGPLAEHAAETLHEGGYENVEVHVASDELGCRRGPHTTLS
jgi:protein-L-isoaspartate(D-aspartate) O-methyltransferase